MINTNNIDDISLSYQTKLVKVIIDEKGYKNKPKKYMGAITNRMSDSKNACEVDLIQLANYITKGHAFAVSYAEGGMSDNNFVSSDLVGLDFDGELSVNEVVKAEKDNWHLYNYYPYNSANMRNTARQFKLLSEVYNEKGSNPNTISYSEYKNIMNDYMDQQNVTSFIMLMDLLTRPRYRHCHPYMTPPPPPPHHHHRH